MKHIKKLLIMVFAIISAFALCLTVPGNKKSESSSAEVLSSTAFTYISLSQTGQSIDESKLKTLVDAEGNAETFIITNNAVTITMKPLQFRYKISVIEDNFYKLVKSIKLEKTVPTENPDEFKFPEKFTFEDRTYYYQIRNGTDLYIYATSPTVTSSPLVSSLTSDLVSFSEDAETRTIHITTAYMSKDNGFVDSEGNPAISCLFNFAIGTSSYSLNIQKPVVNFFNLTQPIVMFDTFKTDDGGNPYPVEKSLAPDQIFNKLKVTFLNNDYTEGNPLYFKINFNGFVYDYTLYSKEFNGENLLFVNYLNESEQYNYNNSAFLATKTAIDENGEVFVVESSEVNAKTALGGHNEFSLIFSETGRYDIEIYDSTYDYEGNGENSMTNANYYKTSFFIREEGAAIEPFDNVYIVAETFDDEGEHVEYIVSDSVQNYITKLTIKNLGDFGKDGSGKDIVLSDVIKSIEILTTDFGIDKVETKVKTYTAEEILELLENNDLVLDFTEDAYYQVIINPAKEDLEKIHYIFTIVRHAKTTFTFNDEIYEASTLYKTDIRYYTNPINSSFTFDYLFTSSEGNSEDITLRKTYVNTFNIKYGVKAVNIEEYTPESKDDVSYGPGFYVKVYGVGDITVYVTVNGKEQEPLIRNSETGNNAVNIEGYGTYTIRIVDSMGTESKTMTFTIKKGLNTSALVLIGLSGVIAAVVIIFILRARGKVATR